MVITLMWTLLKTISILLILSFPAYAKIGDVIEQEGVTNIERKDGDKFQSIEKDFNVESYDVVKTKNGRTAIEFLDETRVDVTENSKLVIDEFVYDPNTKTGSLSLKSSFGTVRYASGQIAKNSRQNVKITTPTAVIGVRGTDFSMTVDETGSSMIILLPSCNSYGNCVVGEITVESDVGMVILNQAFQATIVTTQKTAPSDPLKLSIDESMISNLLIVRKPVEFDEEAEYQRTKKLADFLGIDYLEFDGLNKDELEVDDENTWTTDLDVDYLANAFLYDVLDQLNKQLALQMRSEFEKTTTVKLGKDPETGLELYDQSPNWVFRRDDGTGNFFEFNLNKNSNYTFDVQQGAFETYDYDIGEGGGNEISVIQSQ